MKVKIISVGKLTPNIKILTDKYQKMSNWQIENQIITPAKYKDPLQIKIAEGKLIKKYLSKKALIIAMEVGGLALTSEKFSHIFTKAMAADQIPNFIIGGAFGLDDSLLALANLKLSLSKMTLPRQLASLVVFEQIYRAETIINNHPYHQ